MKIENLNPASVIQISDIPTLDPITLIAQDFGPGRGRVIVECYGEAWSAYWGGIPSGRTTLEFLASMNAGYLHSKLTRPKQTKAVDAYLWRIVAAIYQALTQPKG